jgi:hypothetical protein
MDRTAAELRLKSMTAWDEDPALSQEEIDDLLEQAKVPDADGLAITDAAWDPTWDLNFAASKGWDLKAGKVVNRFRFEEDNQVFHRNQIHDHCLAMSKRYGRGAAYARVGG